jgi:putative hemolysin
MPVPHLGLRLLLLAFILFTNAFFAAAEVALLSVRETRLKQMAAEGEAGARTALQLLANPQKLLSMTQVGVTLASMGLGWAGEDTLYTLAIAAFHPLLTPATAFGLQTLAFIAAFLVISYGHVVIGEVLPKNVAVAKADRLAAAVAPVLLVFMRISRPFVAVVERSSSFLTRRLGVQPHHRGGHSSEELRYIIASSRGSGHIPELQEDMIHRVLDLDQLSAREVMIARNDIVSISADAGLDQVLNTMIEQQHSRLPVYEGSREQIIGVLYYKDLLPVWQERRAAVRSGERARVFRVRSLMRKHMVVPETKPLVQLLTEFQSGKSHLAMVVDEFGTVSGLITVEDVLEQLVGRIEDEYDEAPLAPATPDESREIEVDGAAKLRDFEMQYGTELPTDLGFETIAGLIFYKLGHIPKVGESIESEGHVFTVLSMERNRIARVRVERKVE